MNAKAPTQAELPGESTLDEALLADVAREVRELHLRMGLAYYLELGRLLLRRFFDSDLEAYRHRAKSHASFRALSKRDDLPVSHTVLFNAVAVVRQYESLPDDSRDELTFTHHKMLLPVKDPDSKERLAAQVATEGLSYRELKSLVTEVRAAETEGERRGRPRLPAFQKTLRQMSRLIEDERSFGDLDLSQSMAFYELEQLADTAKAASTRLAELERDIRRRIQSLS